MKKTIASLLILLGVALSFSMRTTPAPAWGQCGGIGWTGPTSCVSGYVCTQHNQNYYQCLPQ